MSSLRILIAGKSNSYLEISKKMLKFHYENCEVDFATSGKECIEKGTHRKYDLILFDYNLGDLNGIQVLEALRTKGISIPIVMLVDEGEEKIALQSLEKGASDYILKVRGYLTALPFTIRNILERKKIIKNTSFKYTRVDSTQETNGKDGYFILDRRGHFISVSPKMEAVTGYSEDELLELSLIDLLPKEKERSYFDWLNLVNSIKGKAPAFRTEIFEKTGNKINLEIDMVVIRDVDQEVVRYEAKAEIITDKITQQYKHDGQINQLDMINQISHAVTSCYHEPLNVLLERIAEIVCQVFRFKRSTVALLDNRKNAFIKQAMIGYMSLPVVDNRTIEVPHEVIDRIFADRFRVKVIYYNQNQRDTAYYLNSILPERRTQKRRPPDKWHKSDLILVNLMNRSGRTFGYISLDEPSDNIIPTRDTFYNLEIFGELVSFAIENYYLFSTIEKRSRRLKQILVTSNIFKLYLSLNDLLKEIVWSIKFSLDFNLAALGLISKKSEHLEIKAVACEDKVKQLQLSEVSFPLKPFAELLRNEYGCGKSYFIHKQEEIFHTFKQIYYGAKLSANLNGTWPIWGLLLVPLKSREGKIIGFLMVDDPDDGSKPGDDVIRILEIIANHVAIAIDNRIMYVQTKKKLQELEKNGINTDGDSTEYTTPTLKGLVDRFFK
ncbi:MAG: response regulator [bacterium]